jgi:ribosome-associated toxin RatA of RatAB toxin-antitoxin module
VSKSALVEYSAAKMFHLVDDVDTYPQFLPWCGGARVVNRKQDEVIASIDIAHGAVRKTFTTRNRAQKNKMIEIQLIDGPFKHLHGFWRFEPLGEQACKVSLDLEYEFANKLISMVVGPVFGKIANTLMDSFCQRAEEIYGRERKNNG